MVLTQTPEPKFGSKAPPFTLPGMEGKVHTLDQCRGPLGLLVMFICNHCPYVQALRDRLVTDMRDIQAAGIGVVAICSNDPKDYAEDSFEHLQRQSREWGFTFPYLHDRTQEVARAFGAVCTPDFFGYNANLELQYRGRLDAGHRGPRLANMRRELVEAMHEIARSGRSKSPQTASMGCSIKWATSALAR